MTISPLAASALRVINAAWVNGTSYDLASQAAYALESAQLLQSPETATELARLRARVAELEADVSPWQRAVDGLNALVDAGVPVHVEPDGHISNPCGDEHIEWDRTAERWRLVHDDDVEVPAAPLPPSVAPRCGHTDDYDRSCDFRPHATGDHGRSVGLTLETWPADVTAPTAETGGA